MDDLKHIYCSECAAPLLPDETFHFGKLSICASCKPVFIQRLKEGGRIDEVGVWRRKSRVVLHVNARLPARCVKCNEPAGPDTSVKHTMRFLQKIPFTGLLSGRALTVQLEIPLCSVHYKRHKLARTMGAVASIMSLSLILAFVLFEIRWVAYYPSLVWAGAFSLIGIAGFMVAFGYHLLRADYRQGNYLRLKLAGKKFLNSLEKWEP